MWLAAVVISLSFFNQAGVAGEAILKGLQMLFGKTVFFLPLILSLGGLVFFSYRYEKFLGAVFLAVFLLLAGTSNIGEV